MRSACRKNMIGIAVIHEHLESCKKESIDKKSCMRKIFVSRDNFDWRALFRLGDRLETFKKMVYSFSWDDMRLSWFFRLYVLFETCYKCLKPLLVCLLVPFSPVF